MHQQVVKRKKRAAVGWSASPRQCSRRPSGAVGRSRRNSLYTATAPASGSRAWPTPTRTRPARARRQVDGDPARAALPVGAEGPAGPVGADGRTGRGQPPAPCGQVRVRLGDPLRRGAHGPAHRRRPAPGGRLPDLAQPALLPVPQRDRLRVPAGHAVLLHQVAGRLRVAAPGGAPGAEQCRQPARSRPGAARRASPGSFSAILRPAALMRRRQDRPPGAATRPAHGTPGAPRRRPTPSAGGRPRARRSEKDPGGTDEFRRAPRSTLP